MVYQNSGKLQGSDVNENETKRNQQIEVFKRRYKIQFFKNELPLLFLLAGTLLLFLPGDNKNSKCMYH